MHEVSLARIIWDQVAEEMARRPGWRLKEVRLSVGAASGAEPESLAFAMEALGAETDYAGADVRIRREPIRLACRACGQATETLEFVVACPACGSVDVERAGGEDLRIESLELESPDE